MTRKFFLALLIGVFLLQHTACFAGSNLIYEDSLENNSAGSQPRKMAAGGPTHFYFPAAGKSIENQDLRSPQQVGLAADFIHKVNQYILKNPYARKKVESARRTAGKPRWALWRHGYLVHIEGNFHKTVDVASLRKTWHAMIVGAAIKQGKIPSLHQRISKYLPELKGNDAEATWWHVITQSAGFDYPYGDYPDYKPGQMWTYSDWNLVHLCSALARVYGKKDFYDRYEDVAGQAYFDAIDMEGWSTRIVKDSSFGRHDGVRFVLSLEHMGRLGLLALARGTWNGVELIPKWFIEELETKQTYGMRVNYNGPNDGRIGLSAQRFPESPYGYLTWVNTDQDLFPGTDSAWACGRGAGGCVVLWNHKNGIVFAGIAVAVSSDSNSIPRIIEDAVAAPNPLIAHGNFAKIKHWSRFEASINNTKRYSNPYTDVTLNVTYRKPDGSSVDFWGFYESDNTWKIRFMPDQTGTWKYNAVFSDGSKSINGTFRCIPSDIGGMISADQTNPMWFGYKGGKHILIRSFHVGDRFFAANWSASKRQTFLDWAQKQGYNMLSVASHYLNRQQAGRGKGWDTPKLWPLNAEQYKRMEAILDELARRKIMIYPFAGFFGQSGDWPTNHEQQEQYIKYTLARIGPYWNVLFNVAGPEPLIKADKFQNAMGAADINRLGQKIKELDVFGHLISIHNPGGDDPFKNKDWLSYVTLQGWKHTNLSEINKGLLKNHHHGKPLYAMEVFWPGNKYHKIRSNVEIRKKAFVIMMSAAAINFGDMNGNSSSGFSGSMELSERKQINHDIVKKVWDFFETIPFYRMSPNQEIVDNGFCLAEQGRQYLVYLPDGGTVNVDIKGGPYKVTWINARSTADKRDAGMTNDGKNLSAPPRFRGDKLAPAKAGGGNDWLLHLTLEGSRKAGSQINW